ncbi:MAG TPA: protein-L-isoaspartate(D-aspartate) O-methyltransferase [Gemmatimonadales bacterium]|nr:protein-L-isoaspartate(D-aspartate) O-methyltransferase [Gemmatimonadales bacterium]
MRGLERKALRTPVRACGSAALLALALAAPGAAQRVADDAGWREQREGLVAERLAPWGISDSATLAAMRAVPRHEFVPPEQRDLAYEDIALPIAQGQTISQPFVVAMMTQVIRPRAGLRVLEVGTGSGYQAAVLAAAGCRVWTIEIFKVLAEDARARLARLGYTGVAVRHGDGYAGWPEAAPFDAVVVTAAADSIPPALLAQLAPRGRLVMPVGDPATEQALVLVEKDAKGRIRSRKVLPVRFVPLLRGVR